MYDPYLYEDVPVLKNKLGIKEEKTLNLIEAEQSSANMMLLYQRGFQNFTPEGLCEIHRFLFGDLYDWAGQYRIINIEKREALLAGRSVWYSNDEVISEDLHAAFQHFMQASWIGISREQFVHQLARLFPPIWQVHPFREGNTRAVVMMLTFFVEHYGYYMDQDLMAASAGYVRNSFVLASLDQFFEYEHLGQRRTYQAIQECHQEQGFPIEAAYKLLHVARSAYQGSYRREHRKLPHQHSGRLFRLPYRHNRGKWFPDNSVGRVGSSHRVHIEKAGSPSCQGADR